MIKKRLFLLFMISWLVALLSSCASIQDMSIELDPILQAGTSRSSASDKSLISDTHSAASSYARNLLSEKLQQIYDQMHRQVYAFETDLTNLNLTKQEFQTVFEHYRADHPEVFWLGGSYEYRYSQNANTVDQVTLSFSNLGQELGNTDALDVEKLESMKHQLEDEAQKIRDGLPEDADEFDKVLYVHDYLATNVVYDKSADLQHTAYGALVEKKAVCDGLSAAMQYLLTQLGMECLMVYGDDKENNPESHAWNIVKVNGEYYHLDITWNMPPDGIDFPVYANFLVNTSQIQKRHQIFSPTLGTQSTLDTVLPAIPETQATSMNYYRKHGYYIENVSDATVKQLFEHISKAMARDESHIQFQFEHQQDLNLLIKEMKNSSKRIQKYFSDNPNYSMQFTSYEQENILLFLFHDTRH